MKSIKNIWLILFLLSITGSLFLPAKGADANQLAQREQKLQESIARLEAQREQVRAELIQLKQELLQLRKEETNQVITVKIILPKSARAVQVEQE